MNDELLNIPRIADAERAERLAGIGFRDGRLASGNIGDLKRFSLTPDEFATIIRGALDSPDPDSALTCLERFLSAVLDAGLDVESFRSHIPFFLKIFGSSEFLSSIMLRRPLRGKELASSPYLYMEKSMEIMKQELSGRTEGVSEYDGLLRVLRFYKQDEMLRIGARDILGAGTVEEITRELSSLASATLDASITFCKEMLKREYGISATDETGSFVVLGMGKLGGNELNFSSDIDLIYLYESGKELFQGKDRGFTPYEFYCKLAELITKAVSAKTGDGFVFRVDLRLRPDGQNGPMVNSLRNAVVYYESWGETWERSAMLKARPVAGDIRLGERFLKEIEPFIFRRYLDFSTIEDIKEMKLKIDRELSLKPGMWDVKLGSGGIREIEFLIQASQLIHAGKDKALRERNSLKALAKLNERGMLSDADHGALKDAYIFLRKVEHMIQVENERQTHVLPSRAEAFLSLAKRCGFHTADEFRRTLLLHSKNVERLFDGIFHEPSKAVDVMPDEVAFFFTGDPGKEEIVSKLRSMGFDEPETAYGILQNLKERSPQARLSQRHLKSLRKLAPHMFFESSRSPDPDMSLVNLDRFLSAVGARGSYYSLLMENPKMVRFLCALFGTSEFLSLFLIRHPELLDSLLRADTATPVKDRDEMKAELDAVLAHTEGYEEIMDAIRRYRNTEQIRIGINDIAEEIDLRQVGRQLSDLAEVILNYALDMSEREMRSRFGAPVAGGKEAGLSVIGMGKFGGREMNYSSDMDLIFIYSGNGETTGPKVVTNQEYFAKVAQRVISFLTLQTREGYLYKVDTRLRPSGSAGTLVSSLESFHRYHAESSMLWERQALIKARPLAGEPGLGDEVMKVVALTVYGESVDDEGRKEIGRLRGRMEKELAKEGPESYNVKTGEGGIVDIEFIAQYLLLKYGLENPKIRNQGTLDALNALSDAGILTQEDCSFLTEAYLFLLKVENRLRIVHNISTDELDLDDRKLLKLARRLGYGEAGDGTPGERFLKDYRMHTEKVRRIYVNIMGGW